jgi:tetraacyldisaccharide 4'-kinase
MPLLKKNGNIYPMHFFEFMYYLGFSAKKHYSLRHQKRLPHRVISIGNLTVGGTGKTPAVMAVAEEAIRRGFMPVVLTRGYRGKGTTPCFVSTGKGALIQVSDAGDEPFLMANKLRGVPIVKAPDRYEGGMFALHAPQSPLVNPTGEIVFILDDGFQHFQLYRDKDVVLINVGDPFGRNLLLPFGKLREPPVSLGRADIIVITKNEIGENDEISRCGSLVEKLRKYNAEAPVFQAAHRPVSWRLLSGERKVKEWISGKRVYGFCALGDPLSFKRTLTAAGATVTGFRAYRDHYHYGEADMRRIKAEAGKSGAEWIVTTEKDIIKIGNRDLADSLVMAEVRFSAEDSFYDEMFSLQRSSREEDDK